MAPVYAIASNIVSSLGIDTAAHWQAAATGRTGIRNYEDSSLSAVPFQASRIDPAQWQLIQAQTQASFPLSPFEQMAIYTATQALQQCDRPIDLSQTVFILSTTKGNIEWLGQAPDERLLLPTSAHIVARQLGIVATPIVISHACVSGAVALTYGLRLLQSGRYKNAVVVGCDRFSRFVLSGFQSFHATSTNPCRPFDAARKGINLGEAAAVIILSTQADNEPVATLLSGASTNDANHLSGPSRTGEELSMAIDRALTEANIAAAQVDMLSAHGTATLFNDEMESKAFALSGLQSTPLHSFKGYIGHTLGAAGVAESAMVMESLRRQQLIPSIGFETIGVSQPLNVTTTMQAANISYALKTASGFGGSNAAIIWQR